MSAYIFQFEKKNTVEIRRLIYKAYGGNIVSADTCERWFRRFESGNFDFEDKPHLGRLMKIEIGNLVAVLKEDPVQLLLRSTAKLNVIFLDKQSLYTSNPLKAILL